MNATQSPIPLHEALAIVRRAWAGMTHSKDESERREAIWLRGILEDFCLYAKDDELYIAAARHQERFGKGAV